MSAAMTDEQFGWWLAGLVDGEGHFGVTRFSTAKRPGPFYRAVFRVDLIAADRDVLAMAHGRTGWGKLYEYPSQQAGHSDYVMWTTTTKGVGDVVDFFKRFTLQSKKRRDFEIWAPAARAQVARTYRGRGKRDEVAAAIMERAYEELRALNRRGGRS